MSEKHKKVQMILNYIEHFLVFISAASGCVSISAFVSLVGFPFGITSSAIWLKMYTLTAKLKSISQSSKKRKRRRRKSMIN